MKNQKTFSFLTVLPVIVFFVGGAAILAFPKFFSHTFIPPDIAAMMRAAITVLLLSIMVSRVAAGDYPGWTWGYALNALAILVLLVTAWIDVLPGGLAIILNLLATIAWLHSSLTQAKRLRQTEYE